ncbi:hypothetical protein JKP88DRAFT_162454 [Tribonema minus]|uniref:Bromo domain-containing protein n=1 Tax=Tribonema minus TaxID=303371 RepID=A0A836CI49_9STRA|nr:hypothetical protein JKP88DRAFT_162454 [Tribonema minus]
MHHPFLEEPPRIQSSNPAEKYKLGLVLDKPVALLYPGIADAYLEAIAEPMDLGTIRRMLGAGRVPSAQAFADTVLLVFNNAIAFNAPAVASDPGLATIVDACKALRRMFRWWCLEAFPDLPPGDAEAGGGGGKGGAQGEGEGGGGGGGGGPEESLRLTRAERDRQRALRVAKVMALRADKINCKKLVHYFKQKRNSPIKHFIGRVPVEQLTDYKVSYMVKLRLCPCSVHPEQFQLLHQQAWH